MLFAYLFGDLPCSCRADPMGQVSSRASCSNRSSLSLALQESRKVQLDNPDCLTEGELIEELEEETLTEIK